MDFLQIKSEKLWGKNLVYTDDVPWDEKPLSIYLLFYLKLRKLIKQLLRESRLLVIKTIKFIYSLTFASNKNTCWRPAFCWLGSV